MGANCTLGFWRDCFFAGIGLYVWCLAEPSEYTYLLYDGVVNFYIGFLLHLYGMCRVYVLEVCTGTCL